MLALGLARLAGELRPNRASIGIIGSGGCSARPDPAFRRAIEAPRLPLFSTRRSGCADVLETFEIASIEWNSSAVSISVAVFYGNSSLLARRCTLYRRGQEVP